MEIFSTTTVKKKFIISLLKHKGSLTPMEQKLRFFCIFKNFGAYLELKLLNMKVYCLPQYLNTKHCQKFVVFK